MSAEHRNICTLIVVSACMCTSEHCFVAAQQFEVVHERRKDALHGAEHGGQTQIQEHEEEQCRPERTGWEQRHGFGECYKRQTSPFHSLSKSEVSVGFSAAEAFKGKFNYYSTESLNS